MARIVKNVVVKDFDGVVAIPDTVRIPKNEPDIDPLEIQRLKNEEFLKQEYDRVYREAYNAATKQSNADIKDMKDRLLQITNKERDEILEKARKESVYMNENAKKNAEDIIAQAKAQYDDICKDAYNTGYKQGFEDKTAELEKFVKKVDTTIEQLKITTGRELKRLESEIETVALEVTQQVLSAEINKDATVMTEMVREAVRSVRDADWITIELSEDLKSLYKELKKVTLSEDTKIEIKTVPSETKGSVVLQLSDRIMDISVFTQLENIRELFNRGF